MNDSQLWSGGEALEDLKTSHGQPTRGGTKPSKTPLFASLNSTVVSDEARALIDTLRHSMEFHERHTGSRTYQRRGAKLEQLEFALGAFVADLLRAANNGEADGWVFRSMKAETFTREPVKYRTFKSIVTALSEAEFLTHVPGYQIWRGAGFAQAENTPLVTEAKAACFRANQPLLGLAKAKGVTPENVHQHFILALPEHPLVLKGSPSLRFGKGGKKKIPGKRLKIERTPETEKLEGDVRRLNEFLDTFTLTGGTHRGYFRVFNQGDHPSFAWDRGGRLYSQGGDSYQSLKEEMRVQMTIDGEAVAEIDLKASYLTALHGLLRLPFDTTQDAYAVEGLKPLEVNGKDIRRWVVKAWTTATLGHHQHHSRWPKETITEFNKKKTGKVLSKLYPIKRVREVMEVKHPILRDWGKIGLSWSELMYAESVAVLNTMIELMDKHQIPGFSIHDSLIVKERDLETAKEAMTRHYKEVAGIRPGLETTYSDGTAQ
jgi:hypothetical protein